MDDNASIMNNKNLVLAASNIEPMAYGYASEELQKDKDLAWRMYRKNPKSIYAHLQVLDQLPKIFEKVLTTDFDSMKSFFHQKLGVPDDDRNYKNMQRLTRNSARGLFKELLHEERKRRDPIYRFVELDNARATYGDQYFSSFTKPMLWKPDIVKEAIDLKRIDIIRELLEDPTKNIEDKIHEDFTALHYATFHGIYNIALDLIDAGADVDAERFNKCTVLNTAIDVAIKNMNNQSMMILQSSNVIYKLLMRGANTQLVKKDNIEILRSSTDKNAERILKLLRAAE